jgi:acetyl esterase
MVDPLDPGELREYDVVYRRDRDTTWLARVYAPADGGPFPALLDVHGGAWSGGTRLANVSLDRALAATGMVVVAIDFRLGPEHPYPASIADVHYAVRWLKGRAAQLNALPEPLGALGTSSGGHMVLLCSMRPDDLRYAALPLPAGEGQATTRVAPGSAA